MDYPDYKLEIKLRIDWSDLDGYGHVNNVSIIKYLQSARVNFWELSGLVESYRKTKKGHILVSSKCDFKKSLFYPGNVVVKSRIAYVKSSSFALEHIVLNDAGEICAEAEDVVVCFDFNTDKTYPVPEDLRKIMKSYASVRSEI